MLRLRVLTLLLFAGLASPVLAGPVEELLRVAPPDAAFVLVIRDAKTHAANLKNSPFADAFSRTPLGLRLKESAELRKLRDAIGYVSTQTETSAASMMDDILGDAVVFALHPGPGGDARKERSILLIRPAKPVVLERFVVSLNALQTGSSEVSSVTSRTHEGETYVERKKSDGTSEYYALRNGTFAFSASEAELHSFLERERAPHLKTVPAFASAIHGLGLESAAVVLLVNPRVLESEITAKLVAGKPSELPFIKWFAAQWRTLDAMALYLRLDKDAEIGLALRPREGENLPFSPVGSAVWSSIPGDALLAMGGQQKLSEVIASINAILPEEGRRSLRAAVEQTLVPVIGKDKLPLVVDALGPNWAMWVEPPRTQGFLPATLLAIEVQSTGPKGTEAVRALTGALQYLFQTVRVMNNARRAEQMELVEDVVEGVVIRSLVGEKSFPPGVQPSFALKDGYLLFATDATAIRRFRKPTLPETGRDVTLLRFSATSLRVYLGTHGAALAAYLAHHSGNSVEDLERWLKTVRQSLEPVDRLEILTKTNGSALHISLRLTGTQSLKP